MPQRHLQIALSAATPGMTLSDAVLDTKGNILLPAGTVLCATLLESLARHQIESVAIAAGSGSAADDVADRERCLARIARLFRTPGTGGVRRLPAQNARQPSSAPPGPPTTPTPEATDTLRQYVLRFRSESTA